MYRETFMKLIHVGLVFAGAIVLSACADAQTSDETTETTDTVTQAATSVTHTKFNGVGASAYFEIENGSAGVSVYENVEQKKRSVYLNYHRSTVDPTSYQCQTDTYCWDPADPSACETYEWCRYTRSTWEYGWGIIPKSAFRVGGNGAELAVDLATVPDFYAETCSWDELAGTGSCNVGPASGIFDLSFAKTNDYSNFNNGTSRSTYGKYAYKTVGQWSSNSAAVDGVAFGAPVNASGDISRSKTTSVSKEIIPATP
jgi:hypothetical protein